MFYGWSWKSADDQYLVAFDNATDAEKWLHTEEYDFRERELIEEDRARELAGEDFEDWDRDHKLRLSNAKN